MVCVRRHEYLSNRDLLDDRSLEDLVALHPVTFARFGGLGHLRRHLYGGQFFDGLSRDGDHFVEMETAIALWICLRDMDLLRP